MNTNNNIKDRLYFFFISLLFSMGQIILKISIILITFIKNLNYEKCENEKKIPDSGIIFRKIRNILILE